MKTPNRHLIVPGMNGPHNDNNDADDDADDEDLRALTSVDLDDDDAPRYRQGERVPEAGATRQNPRTRPRRQRAGSKRPGLKGPD